MRIKSIRLRNFKRFTDLRIQDIPSSAKLVVVVGRNGCGKSSLFDALYQWYQLGAGFGHSGDEAYYRKSVEQHYAISDAVTVQLFDAIGPVRGCLYVRTAYRNDPDFSVGGVGRLGSPVDGLRFRRIIDNDQTVSENYQRVVYETMAGVFNTDNDEKQVKTLRNELIGDVRESMTRVFGDLLLNNISDPLGGGAFYFEKGTAKSYHYKNLSGGEKAAFDLILDMHVKRRFYSDAIYCIDEVETHLHTKVQGSLIRELLEIIPGQSQLWVTTHSLGVLRAAQDIEAATPGVVCVIEFDGIDLDQETVLTPSTLGRVSWEKMLSLTLDDLSTRIVPKMVVTCEGSSVGRRRKDFDAEVYNRILASQAPDLLFVSGGNSSLVEAVGAAVEGAVGKIIPALKVVALRDRDDLSPEQVKEIEEKGSLVLRRRNVESYLLSSEVIEALVRKVRVGAEEKEIQDRVREALAIREAALSNSVQVRGNAPDDLKSASGEIYVGLKKLLGLTACGNNTDAFMRDTLAPLVTPGTATYQSLKEDVLDRLSW